MDITQLRYFLSLTEHMNYTHAAEELLITRQALQKSIQTLERDLGTRLLDNQKNRLSLTVSGEALRDKALSLVCAFDQAEFEIREMNHQFNDLPIAYSVSVLTFLFPLLTTLLSGFQDAHPAFHMRTHAVENDEIWRLLREDKIKFGILMLMPWETPDYTFVPLQTFRLGITLSPSHPLAAKASLTLSDLNGERLMGMGSLSTTFQPLEHALKENSLSLHYEVAPDTIDAFYHAKHGNAMIFDIITPSGDASPITTVRPLEEYFWSLCLVYKSSCRLTPAEAFFFRYLKDHLKSL